jgi:hypothetical protein
MEFQIFDVAIDVVFSSSKVGVHLAHDDFATIILNFGVTRYNKKFILPFFGNVSIGSIFMDQKKNMIRIVSNIVSMD